MRTTPFACLPFERVDQPGLEASFAFPLRGAATALTTPQPGIEQAPHRVAKHVEGVDDICQAKPRPERQPGGHLHVLTSFPAEQTTPAGNIGGQTEAEKAQQSTPPPYVVRLPRKTLPSAMRMGGSENG